MEKKVKAVKQRGKVEKQNRREKEINKLRNLREQTGAKIKGNDIS